MNLDFSHPASTAALAGATFSRDSVKARQTRFWLASASSVYRKSLR